MSLDGAEYVRLDAVAVRASVALVDRLTVADLDRPTPCAGWTLRDLLSHMTAQHVGFAAAAAGNGDDPATWQVPVIGDDFAGTYAEASAGVLAAFAADGALDRRVVLPELSTEVTFAAARAISFHFIDYVVHSWDVAASVGLPVSFDADVLDAALDIAEHIPDGASRVLPGAAFRPALPVSDGAAPLDRIVALLGRAPGWRPAAADA